MLLYTAGQMRAVDEILHKVYKMPEEVLLENAGRSVATIAQQMLVERYGKEKKRLVGVLCGTGNNGGDGLVAARYLANSGYKVRVILSKASQEYQGNCAYLLKLFSECEGGEIFTVEEAEEKAFANYALVIDAIAGTGLKGTLRGGSLRLVLLQNEIAKRSKCPTLAVDIPSGVNADTGAAVASAVEATATVTMIAPKRGLYLYPGAKYAGEITVADLGIPSALLTHVQQKKWYEDYVALHVPAEGKMRQYLEYYNLADAMAATSQDLLKKEGKVFTLDKEGASKNLPKRKETSHKGECGKVKIVAGSSLYTGAPALTAMAAARMGAGLVTLYSPQAAWGTLATKLTEVMVRSVGEKGQQFFVVSDAKRLSEELQDADVVALGPGIAREAATGECIRELLAQLTKPVVIDADALYALKGHTELLPEIKGDVILTPHYGEMSYLTGLSCEEIAADPVGVATNFANKWNAVVVLKGAHTVTALPNEGGVFACLNTTGSSAMATGGMGDVLTGVIASLEAQGLAAQNAAYLGVYLHGLAADVSGEGIGLIASDVIKALPKARESLE